MATVSLNVKGKVNAGLFSFHSLIEPRRPEDPKAHVDLVTLSALVLVVQSMPLDQSLHFRHWPPASQFELKEKTIMVHRLTPPCAALKKILIRIPGLLTRKNASLKIKRPSFCNHRVVYCSLKGKL